MEEKKFTSKGVYECLSGVKKGLETIKEGCGNPGVPYVAEEICGLSKRDTINLVEHLKALHHAIDEKDWDRLKEYKYQRALEKVKNYAEVMTAANCACPPHGILEPSEVAEGLQKSIKEENAENGLGCIANLYISLLEELLYM